MNCMSRTSDVGEHRDPKLLEALFPEFGAQPCTLVSMKTVRIPRREDCLVEDVWEMKKTDG